MSLKFLDEISHDSCKISLIAFYSTANYVICIHLSFGSFFFSRKTNLFVLNFQKPPQNLLSYNFLLILSFYSDYSFVLSYKYNAIRFLNKLIPVKCTSSIDSQSFRWQWVQNIRDISISWTFFFFLQTQSLECFIVEGEKDSGGEGGGNKHLVVV